MFRSRATAVAAAVAAALGLGAVGLPSAGAAPVPSQTQMYSAVKAACVRLNAGNYAANTIETQATSKGTTTRIDEGLITSPSGTYRSTYRYTVNGHPAATFLSGSDGTTEYSTEDSLYVRKALAYAGLRGPYLITDQTPPLKFGPVQAINCAYGIIPPSKTALWSQSISGSAVAYTVSATSNTGYFRITYFLTDGAFSGQTQALAKGPYTFKFRLTIAAAGASVVVPGIPSGYTEVTEAQYEAALNSYEAMIVRATRVALNQLHVRAAADAVAINRWAKLHHQAVSPHIVRVRLTATRGYQVSKAPDGVKITHTYNFGKVTECVIAHKHKAVPKQC